MRPRLSTPKVILVGGGLAGVAAALSLQKSGCEVTLIEKRPYLGGRAFSFGTGYRETEIDNSQHVFLGCCSNYLEFLRWTSVLQDTKMQKKFCLEISLDGRKGKLSSVPFLGKAHLLPSFIKYPHLKVHEKIRVVLLLWKISLLDISPSSGNLDSLSLEDWMIQNGQSKNIIRRLWDVFILSTLNDSSGCVSAYMGLKVIQDGILSSPTALNIGWSNVGLTRLLDGANNSLKDLGADIVMGETVRNIEFCEDRWHVITARGNRFSSEHLISALQPHDLLSVLSNNLRKYAMFDSMDGIEYVPIIGFHVWYDREIMQEEFLAFVDSPIQWIFNKTAMISGYSSENDGRQYLCASVGGAHDLIDTPKSELEALLMNEMLRLFPLSKKALILKSIIVKEPYATIRVSPGASTLRPRAETELPGFYLAGEWTDTGWPSTMEGAVKSGLTAADTLMSRVTGG